MFKKALHALVGLFANRNWHVTGDAKTGQFVARRWTDTGWEMRPAMPEEIMEAAYWQANR